MRDRTVERHEPNTDMEAVWDHKQTRNVRLFQRRARAHAHNLQTSCGAPFYTLAKDRAVYSVAAFEGKEPSPTPLAQAYCSGSVLPGTILLAA